MRCGRLPLQLLLILSLLPMPASGDEGGASVARFRQWIAEMKTDPRGPFRRIRWFCNDGEVLPPVPYACVPHGGGVQHGQWSERTERLRAAGYPVANVLAEYGRDAHAAEAVDRWLLAAILLERFLVNRDDGWIFRRARFYRGALQREDEARGESALVRHFAMTLGAGSRDHLLLWEAARLLPGSGDVDLLVTLRDLATAIHDVDDGFASLRNKLHSAPAAADAAAVRAYARDHPDAALRPRFEALAATIDAVFDPGPLAAALRATARKVTSPALRRWLLEAAAARQPLPDAERRFVNDATLLRRLREQLDGEPDPAGRERLLRLGRRIEQDLLAAASALRDELPRMTRRQRLGILRHSADGLFGVGLLTRRQWRAVQAALDGLDDDAVELTRYRATLRYLARTPRWSAALLNFHFGQVVERFAVLEPLARQFVPARLRGSPLAFHVHLLDTLRRDADRLAGISSELFGEQIATGLRALNPGLARGRLLRVRAGQPLVSDGIYLLPETTADLEPVAGILTLDEGNALSHLQLLAANLGIPNVVISRRLLPRLEAHLGERVVLAVSPGGIVRLAADGPAWDAVFEQAEAPETPLRPNVEKLDLTFRRFVPLDRLRAADAGVIVGPKAANLGELKHFFPEAVADGVVIPFGRFRAFLDRPIDADGQTAWQWMEAWYRHLDSLHGETRWRKTRSFLQQLHDWIERASPGDAFRRELAAALAGVFGRSEGLRLFVRSDTNVEDLPGFTGAGLNLTVPNVVGMDALVRAVMRVWASPFTERAFRWRQRRMTDPMQVYPSVLLLETVTVEKSGVLLTFDVLDGDEEAFTVAVAHGIGGVVGGGSAEELLVRLDGDEVRLLNSATRPTMQVAGAAGGLVEMPVPPTDAVLTTDEIERLRAMVKRVREHLPQYDDAGRPTPADIEFGFDDGRLVLFQIRPYLRNAAARRNRYLLELDRRAEARGGGMVAMDEKPEVLR